MPRGIFQTGFFISNQTQDYMPLYVVGKSYYGQNETYGYIILALSIMQGVGLLLLLVIVNLVNTFKLIRFLSKKKEASASNCFLLI